MERVYSMFEIPPEAEFHCCIPLGYPRGKIWTDEEASNVGDHELGAMECKATVGVMPPTASPGRRGVGTTLDSRARH